MADKETNKSPERCAVCGKTEAEAGKLITIPPHLKICPDCLDKEINQMSDMFSFMINSDKSPSSHKQDTAQKKHSDKSTEAPDAHKTSKITQSGSSDTDGNDSALVSVNDNDEQADENEDKDKSDDEERRRWGAFALPAFFAGGGSPFGMDVTRQHPKRDSDEPPLEPVPLPHELKKQLDEYVVGQDLAKKTVAVAAYNHYKRAQAAKNPDIEIEKSNILLLGPTGTGKTYLIKTLAKILDVPLAISDATTLTQAGYVGDDIESIITKLITAADGDIERAEYGIIYIDEIDKIAKRNGVEGIGGGRDIGGESVQQGLLKVLEGTSMEVPLSGGMKTPFSRSALINTNNILFICGGAFPGLKDIIIKRLNKGAGVGFGMDVRKNYEDTDEVLEKVTTEDLKDYGFIPEFIGRLPIVCTMHPLTESMLLDILTQPHDALIKQYQALMAYDDVELAFDESALKEIARRAINEETGARALRAILEKFMLNIMFEVPKDANIGKVTITGDYVRKQGMPLVETRS